MRKSNFIRFAVVVVLFLAFGQVARAGQLAIAMTSMGDSLKAVASEVATVLGPVMTLIGGGRASWKAAHGQEFTTALVQAIVGVAIFGAAAL